ncbi:MAG TPA: RNA-binding S4 domain-containing protein [bacterium]|nr:RNA-binding S4 domain-containing protein [bacterium]
MHEFKDKTIRLDKWLKIARIFKTRNQAAEGCAQGKVKVNDQTAKAAKMIKIGDSIEVKFKWRVRRLDVVDIVNKSIKAAEAKLLYHEHEPTAEEKQADDIRSLFYQASRMQKPKYKGRPTKKERRDMERFRNSKPTDE